MTEPAVRKLADAIAALIPDGKLEFVTGTVSAVAPDPSGQATVTTVVGDVTAPSLASYSPAIGDVVAMLVNDNSPLILGAVVASGPAPGSGYVIVGDTTGFTDSTAITATIGAGSGSGAFGPASIAIGPNAETDSGDAIALGDSSQAIGSSSLAIGPSAYCQADYAVAIGRQASVGDVGPAVVIGLSARAVTGEQPVVIGRDAIVGALDAGGVGNPVAVGHAAQVQGVNGIALGGSAYVATAADWAMALGHSANAGAAGSVAIGTDSTGAAATTTGANDFTLGTAAHKVSVPGLFAVHGATPVAQSAHPTTLADLIAVCQAHGLCA